MAKKKRPCPAQPFAAHLVVGVDPSPPFKKTCACGCGRRRPVIAVEDGDPFARAECAQAWHGVRSSFPKGRGVFSQAATL